MGHVTVVACPTLARPARRRFHLPTLSSKIHLQMFKTQSSELKEIFFSSIIFECSLYLLIALYFALQRLSISLSMVRARDSQTLDGGGKKV
jgi:hypothetical protein